MGAIPLDAGLRRKFNLKERFCCRFAADAATTDRRHNFLLRLAAARDAGSVCIDRADWLAYAFPRAEGRLSESAESCVELLESVSVALVVACIRQMTEQLLIAARAPTSWLSWGARRHLPTQASREVES